MPRFTTISPTSVRGKKKECWESFRDGGYIAVGWFDEVLPELKLDFSKDLTGYSLEEILAYAHTVYTVKNTQIFQRYHPDWLFSEPDREIKKIEDVFKKFLTLEIGDYVAANNTNDGLFGIGRIMSGYKFEKGKHYAGRRNTIEKYYPHYREVDWIITTYMKRTDIIKQGETSWQPYGTMGKMYDCLPSYVERILKM